MAQAQACIENARLLIVDDIADNRSILNRRFTKLGYKILEADGGLAAVRLIDQQDFDLVLLDIVMPGIDGIEVLKRIRGKHSPDSLPVIMITGKTSNTNDIIEAFELGANDYLSKPVDFQIALARVQSQLARKRAQQALEHSIAGLAEINRKLEANLAQRNRSEAQHHTAPSLLDMVVENVPAALFVKNARDHRYVMLNGPAENLWGISRAEVIGKTAHDIFEKDEADQIEAREAAALNSGLQLVIERHPMKTPGNRTRVISSKIFTIRNSQEGDLLLSIVDDITDDLRVEERSPELAGHETLPPDHQSQ
jgi:PAS domain S-box-containing protein